MTEILKSLLDTDLPALQQVAPDIQQMYQEAEELKTGDELRDAELTNIQQVIIAAVDTMIKVSHIQGEEVLNGVAVRLQKHREDPTFLGNHTHHLAREQYDNFMSSMALKGNKTKLLDFVMNQEVRDAQKRLLKAVPKDQADRIQDDWYKENAGLFT